MPHMRDLTDGQAYKLKRVETGTPAPIPRVIAYWLKEQAERAARRGAKAPTKNELATQAAVERAEGSGLSSNVQTPDRPRGRKPKTDAEIPAAFAE